uniref:Uncharacterized protein n=1 Tax=Salix viminalis TaxID=40686 RepID=A0A6N2MTQ6_SALVM
MSPSSATSRYLARGFYLTSNPLLSKPSLFQRLLRRRLKRLVVLFYSQPRDGAVKVADFIAEGLLGLSKI